MKKYLKMLVISCCVVFSYVALWYCITLYVSGQSYYPYMIDQEEIAFLLFLFYLFVAVQVVLDKIDNLKK